MSNDYTLTMRSLEKQPSSDHGYSALDEWYLSIRDIPLYDLPIGDIARSLRQSLYPDFVVPVAIRHLRENPLAGHLYDGELLVSLRNGPKDSQSAAPLS
jgi:CDI immunity proteins